jgi:hypothetical protein
METPSTTTHGKNARECSFIENHSKNNGILSEVEANSRNERDFAANDPEIITKLDDNDIE